MFLLNIIIPNFNGSKFLSRCLDSIFKQSFTSFVVTVVDNGSTDDSLSLIHSCYPQIHTIELSENKGFAEACNIGICSKDTPYVMLLNNDTELEPDCVEHMMTMIQKSDHIFSVGPTILTMDQTPLVDTVGDYYSLFGYAFCRQQGLPDTPHKSHAVFTNTACAVIYRKELLEKTKLLENSFFAYLEDVDLGMRARLLGLTNYHCSKARLYHYGSGTSTTTNKYSPLKVYYSARNNQLLRARNLNALQRILHSPFVFLGTLLKYFYFQKLQLHHEYLHGVLDGLRMSHRQKSSPCKSFRTRMTFELWIWYGSFLYVKQFLKRKLF